MAKGRRRQIAASGDERLRFRKPAKRVVLDRVALARVEVDLTTKRLAIELRDSFHSAAAADHDAEDLEPGIVGIDVDGLVAWMSTQEEMSPAM